MFRFSAISQFQICLSFFEKKSQIYQSARKGKTVSTRILKLEQCLRGIYQITLAAFSSLFDKIVLILNTVREKWLPELSDRFVNIMFLYHNSFGL